MGPQLALTDVSQAFHEHEIILTGANGFLGKVILGLILDRFPGFKHLHLLLRPSRGLSAQERFFAETLAPPALRAVVGKRGEDFVRQRITVWAGDISRPYCGVDVASLEQLAGRVGLILNCAGSVEFFPPVDLSFASNVDGVEHVVALAHLLGSKLLHVSTCYVCGPADGLVEETEPILGFYPRRKGPEDASFNHAEEIRYCRERIRQIVESVQRPGRSLGAESGLSGGEADVREAQRRAQDVAERLVTLGRQRAAHWGWVNTYTYAKSLGEQIIAAEPGLDYAIVRPAIVESALEFPFPGWIEGGRTAAPLVLMALGGLKHWPVRKDLPLEVVPVDMVASAILVVSALLLDGRHEPVYQLGTADVNPILLGPLVTLLEAESRRRPDRSGNGTGARPRSGSRNGSGRAVSGFVERLAGARRGGRVRFVSAEGARLHRQAVQKRIGRAQAVISRAKRVLAATGLPGTESLSGLSSTLRTLGLQAGFREQTLDQYLPFILENRYIFESENIRTAYTQISESDRNLVSWLPQQIDWKSYWVNNQIPGVEKWVQPEAVKSWRFRI